MTKSPFLDIAAGSTLGIWLYASVLGVAYGASHERLFDAMDLDGDGLIVAKEVESGHQRLFARMLRKADADGDGGLSYEEFADSLTPRSPEKPIVEKLSGELPGAAAAQLLLLKMDTNRDSRIDSKEVPIELLDAFDQLVERVDRNNDDRLTRLELARGGPQLSRISQRIARQMALDVPAELARYRRTQGKQARRFEEAPRPENVFADPEAAKEFFEQLDGDGDGLIRKEDVPEPIRQLFSRLMRMADRDNDGALTQQEFLRGARRIGRFMQRMESQ